MQLRISKLLIILVIFVGLSYPKISLAQKEKTGQAPFLKSLIIPGWGQYSLGQNNVALGFFGAEVVLLGGILSLKSYGNSVRDDYKHFAAVHAGVMNDLGHDYFVDVGNWMTVEEFNAQRERNREFDGMYNTETEGWHWDSDGNRAKMENMRIKSDKALNSVYYLAGGMLLNHLASALHAGRVAANRAKQKTSLQSELRLLQVSPVVMPAYKGLTITRHF